MQKQTFTAGVVPGGLNDRQAIKILICFIFYKLDRPLKKSDISSILQKESLANYFEISQAFAEMVNNKNIIPHEEEPDSYVITESGKMVVKELSSILPTTVREKAIKSADSYLNRLKNEKENKVIIKKNDHGYTVTCKISGGEFNMLELKLYAPDILAASTIKNNFYKDPENLYNIVISALTDSEHINS